MSFYIHKQYTPPSLSLSLSLSHSLTLFIFLSFSLSLTFCLILSSLSLSFPSLISFPSTYPSYLSSLLFISIFYPLFVPLYPLLISLSCHGCYLCEDLQVWRTDPGSIFDLDPVEDNIQSKSLQRLSGTALPLISVTLFIDISIYQSFYIYSIVCESLF